MADHQIGLHQVLAHPGQKKESASFEQTFMPHPDGKSTLYLLCTHKTFTKYSCLNGSGVGVREKGELASFRKISRSRSAGLEFLRAFGIRIFGSPQRFSLGNNFAFS